MDCKHCNDLRARTEKVTRKTWQNGLYLIDGMAADWREYQGDPVEVQACPCSCHNAWKQMQSPAGHMKEMP
jgi:hypothetical protein